MVERKIKAVLEADDRASSVIRRVAGELRDLSRLGSSLSSFGRAWSLSVTAPIVALGTLASRSAIQFESSFAGVRKTVNATEQELEQLQIQLREMAAGEHAIPVDVNELNRIAEAAGQLGIRTENIVEFTRVMAALGVTTNLTSDQAATSLARFANITQIPQTEVDRLGSAIVHLGNTSATTEAEILGLGLRLAAAGKQIGLTEAQILGVSAAVSSLGVSAEAGGTAFSRVFADIGKAVAQGGDRLSKFASIAGLSSREFSRVFKTDASSAIVAFVRGLQEVSRAGGDVFTVLEDVELGNVRVRDALLRVAGGGDILAEKIREASAAFEANNALTTEAGKRYETTASKIQIARNQINEAAITIGNELLPLVADTTKAVASLAKSFSALSPEVRQTALAIAGLLAAVGPLSLALGVVARLSSAAFSVVSSLAGGALSLSLGFDKGAVAMARASSASQTFAAASLAQKAGIVGLSGAVLGLSFELTRMTLEATGANRAITEMLSNAQTGLNNPRLALEKFDQQGRLVARTLEKLNGLGIEIPVSDETRAAMVEVSAFFDNIEKGVPTGASFGGLSEKIADSAAEVAKLQPELRKLLIDIRAADEATRGKFVKAFQALGVEGGDALANIAKAWAMIRGEQAKAAQTFQEFTERTEESGEALSALGFLTVEAANKATAAMQKLIASVSVSDRPFLFRVIADDLRTLEGQLLASGRKIPQFLQEAVSGLRLTAPEIEFNLPDIAMPQVEALIPDNAALDQFFGDFEGTLLVAAENVGRVRGEWTKMVPEVVSVDEAVRALVEGGIAGLEERLSAAGAQVQSLSDLISGSLREVGVDAALQFGDALVDAAFEGKVNFKEFFKQLLKDIAKAIIQALILKAIMASISGGSSEAASPIAGIFGLNKGGIVKARRGVLVGGPRLDRDIVPALLTPGEAVLPREMTDLLMNAARNGGGGGRAENVSVQIAVNAPSGTIVDMSRVLEANHEAVGRAVRLALRRGTL